MTDFEQWASSPASPMMHDPVNLLELGRAIEVVFSEKQIEVIKQAIVALIESGKRPIFRAAETGVWEWTDRLYVTPSDELFETPDTAAEMAIMCWQDHGTGEVAQFWFGTHLPTR